MAAACARGRVVIWETRTGRVAHVLEEEGQSFLDVAFHPDGSLLAATTWGPEIRLFNVADWSPRGTLLGPHAGSRHVEFSPDGELLFLTRFGFLALSLAEGSRVFRHEVDNDFYGSSVAPSPDGTLVAWGEPDGTVGLWGAATSG